MNTRTPKSKQFRIYWWISGISLLIVIAVVGIMYRVNATYPSLDLSRMRSSDNGLFNISYSPSEDPVPVNRIHQWTLHVETAAGDPVEGASITVDGDMPQHGHGLPTQPRVTGYLGNGDYLVEGMRFQMTGWWVVDFTVSADGQTDLVRFNLMLK